MNNKEQINNAILFRQPEILVANTQEYSLKIEIDLFNGHIEWLIEKDNIDIFTSYDSTKAIDKFCELIGNAKITLCI